MWIPFAFPPTIPLLSTGGIPVRGPSIRNKAEPLLRVNSAVFPFLEAFLVDAPMYKGSEKVVFLLH